MNFYAKFGIGVMLLAGLGFLIVKFSFIASNIIGGFVLFFLMTRFLDFLERKGATEAQAYICLLLVFSILILSFILYVSIPFVEQFGSFSHVLPEKLEHLKNWVEQNPLPFLASFAALFQEKISSEAERWLSATGAIATSIITIPIIAVILLSSRKTMKQSLLEIIPNDYFEVTFTIANDIVAHIQDYVWAKSAETFFMILIYAVGFYIVGVPNSLLLAFLGGILNIIPYIGPLVTALLIFAWAIVGGASALILPSLAVLAVAQFIDNIILQTWLVSRLVDVHPFIVVIATLIGGEVLGVLGMVIAIPAYVISKIVLTGLYSYFRAVQRHVNY